jgi:hypothetical protein
VIASVTFLEILVTGATVVATAAPLVLIVLFVLDARGGKLW